MGCDAIHNRQSRLRVPKPRMYRQARTGGPTGDRRIILGSPRWLPLKGP